jgi:protoheme IX farnesyltransferase
MGLKRRTPQNIVIGGAAGALPPVIGWAAASGQAPANAWLLFAIIFLWTPPHFWALALNTGEDYARAGVPMMPVARGAASTRRQIWIYSLILVSVATLPVLTRLGHAIYAAAAFGGGAVFLVVALRLWRSQAGERALPGPDGLYAARPGAREARDLFAFSILYLTLLFAALLAEHAERWFR